MPGRSPCRSPPSPPGCVLWRRDLLRCREAVFGALIAVGLLVPNVIWQMGHG